MGFHADQEAMRVLGKAINYARLGQTAIHGGPLPETAPDLTPPLQLVTPAGD